MVGGSFSEGIETTKPEPVKMTDYEQTRATAAEEKSQKLAFESCLRIVYRGNTTGSEARLRMQSIIASYKQFNTTYLNGFEARLVAGDQYIEALYRARDFNRKVMLITNIEEVATLYHLPHTNVETPYILWSIAQTAEPPANLPIVDTTTAKTLAQWRLLIFVAITRCLDCHGSTVAGTFISSDKPAWENPVCLSY